MSPKATKRTPRGPGWNDPNRHDPGHDLNQNRTAAKKKNTKRWCKGKAGRAHDYQIAKKYRGSWFSYDVWVCSNCGKKDWRTPPTVKA
jgi:hypothetical protein